MKHKTIIIIVTMFIIGMILGCIFIAFNTANTYTMIGTAIECHTIMDIDGESWYTDDMLEIGAEYLITATNNGTTDLYDDEIIKIEKR